MIINGGSRSNGAFFAQHLTNGEHNERVTLCEMRNLAATNISDAFREMEAIAMGTLCKNHFYHANINPTEHETLTQEQWTIAVDTLERHLGLNGHARFIVEHQKKGRTHRHVIWSRIDVSAMRAAVMADDYAKHQAAARELETVFGLKAVESVLGPKRSGNPRPLRRPKTWETFRGQKSGIDPIAMTRTLTRLYHECADGAGFAAALAEHGLTLVMGRASVCIRDAAGDLHSLARRLDRVSAAELRAFLRDLAIPSLQEGSGN
jgi:hypothetical protein